jgi:hypothetical protein
VATIVPVLGHDTRLDGVSARGADSLLVGQPERGQAGAGGDAKLRLDQIEAHHLLGDRVFDLNARIALDEIVLTRLRVDEKLDRAGVFVAGGLREFQRIGQDALAQARVQVGRRRHLDHLLVAQLHRAVALEQMHHVALTVAQHLHLDVPGPRHRFSRNADPSPNAACASLASRESPARSSAG